MAGSPSSGMPYLGVEVSPEQAGELLRAVAARLAPGEIILGLVTTVKALPTLTHLGVTDRRIIGFKASALNDRGFAVEAASAAVTSAHTRPSYKQREFLVVVDGDGAETDFGDVHGDDGRPVLKIIEQAAAQTVASPSPVPASAPPHTAPSAPRVSGWRFNPPPTWPPAPPGWTPPPGWQPDPSRPPPPRGWQLWVPAVAPAQPSPHPVAPHAPIPPPSAASEYVGVNGRILLEGETLILVRSGLRSKMVGHAEESRRIPFQAISGVRYKEAGRMVNGYLQLGLGGVEPQALNVGNAASDPDTVLFTWGKRNDFEHLRSRLQQVVTVNRASGTDPAAFPYDGASPTRPIEPNTSPGTGENPTRHQPPAGHSPPTGPTRSAAGKGAARKHRAWPVIDPPKTTPSRLPKLVASPAWLPGDVEIEIVGEFYREPEVRAAAADPGHDGVRAAVLVPEPRFSKYPDAVAVYVQTFHVGFIAKEICGPVHRAIIDFAAAHDGQLPSCPAEFYQDRQGQQVALLIDPRPLGLQPSLFSDIPDIADSVERLLSRLAGPSPVLHGHHDAARRTLAAVATDYAQVKETWSDDRPIDAWPALENRVRALIQQLEQASDPKVADAWLMYARCVRYQRGRRDDTLAGYFGCLYNDRNNSEAWAELFEYVCAAPHIPMLLDLYRHVPLPLRTGPARRLLAVSHGRDRHGNMPAHRGERLRVELKALAASQNDTAPLAVLAEDAGRRAEKDGDEDAAIAAYREAVAAGSTNPRVADRLSIWLVKQELYAEAEKVLTQALQQPPTAASTRDRLEKRLRRCQRHLSGPS
ncbi:DUF4429 domain-containing protein [Actinomadura verrucosospora]|uniref:DUF4429 domain-containing protein n=2 Tax=Actinomadura verrucosospora TaxID=46165 RepID=UPI0031F12E64